MNQPKQHAIHVHGVPVELPAGEFREHGEPRTLAQFAGPIREEWKQALTARGIVIEFWCPPFGACLRLPADLRPPQLQPLFPFLVAAAPYEQHHCRRRVEPHAEHVRRWTGLPPNLVDIICFDRSHVATVSQELEKLGIRVVDRSGCKLRVRYAGDLAVLRDLHGVRTADAARGSVVLASSAMAIALGAANGNGDWDASLDGDGEVLAIADTGVDIGADGPNMHADLRGRVATIQSWPINPSWSDVVVQAGYDDGPADKNTGHGTHVTGLAAGDGTVSGGVVRGPAPKARVVFHALEQYCAVKPAAQSEVASGYYLAGRPLELRDLLLQQRAQGARIHVNSWGDPADGGYTSDCKEADMFLRANPDALVLFAAGNDGADRDADGRIDPGSLYAPASAKNVLTVGATEGPAGGLQGGWSVIHDAANRFANTTDRATPLSGSPDRIALISSAGPTQDGRIKPDVCAPGTNVAGPRSQACQSYGWAMAPPPPYYMYEGGTSCATGVAGGVAAVVRQAWRKAQGTAPSGVALKAILICGAAPVRGRLNYPEALPREAGFGRLQVQSSLPGAVQLLMDGADALHTGDTKDYAVTVGAAGSLRAVLTWYDSAGSVLVNDLSLTILAPDGSTVFPAAGAPEDHINNVRVANLGGLNPGTYTLRVAGYNVPDSPQSFALAVTS